MCLVEYLTEKVENRSFDYFMEDSSDNWVEELIKRSEHEAQFESVMFDLWVRVTWSSKYSDI